MDAVRTGGQRPTFHTPDDGAPWAWLNRPGCKREAVVQPTMSSRDTLLPPPTGSPSFPPGPNRGGGVAGMTLRGSLQSPR